MKKLVTVLVLAAVLFAPVPTAQAASGDTLIVFTALHAELPSTAFASWARRNDVFILQFDDTTDESAEFGAFMPRNYGGGGVTVTLGWAATSATTNDVVWEAAFMSVSDDADDLDTKAFAAVNFSTCTTASASGELDYCTITFTDGADMDSVAAGEYFRLQVNRDADDTNGTDNLSGDAELVFVEIKES